MIHKTNKIGSIKIQVSLANMTYFLGNINNPTNNE